MTSERDSSDSREPTEAEKRWVSLAFAPWMQQPSRATSDALTYIGEGNATAPEARLGGGGRLPFRLGGGSPGAPPSRLGGRAAPSGNTGGDGTPGSPLGGDRPLERVITGGRMNVEVSSHLDRLTPPGYLSETAQIVASGSLRNVRARVEDVRRILYRLAYDGDGTEAERGTYLLAREALAQVLDRLDGDEITPEARSWLSEHYEQMKSAAKAISLLFGNEAAAGTHVVIIVLDGLIKRGEAAERRG